LYKNIKNYYPVYRTLSLSFLIVVFLGTACKRQGKTPDISDISLETEILRFEQELFSLSIDSIPESIDYFYESYDDFFEVFSFHILDLGLPSDKAFGGYLTLFVRDNLNREVYEEVQRVFPDLTGLEEEFNRAFRYYSHYFPGKDIPQLVSYISRFSYPYFTVQSYAGIGLDMYLGADSEYYDRAGIPEYLQKNMIPEKIVSDVLANWGNSLYEYNDSIDNVLGHIIHEGKLMYFVSRLLPEQPDSLIFGFSKDQMKWVKNNEEPMWTYLIENKLLYSTDPMEIRKLVNPAPFTTYFTQQSPGRSVVWTGYQIIVNYMKHNDNLDLKGLMENTDYQEILQGSRYSP